MRLSPTRRDILSAGAIGAASLALPRAARAMVRPATPGIKIGAQAPRNPTKQDLKFFKQIGFDHVYSNYTPGTGGANVPSVDDLKTRKQIWADAGLNLHNIRWFSGSLTTGSMDLAAILLGLPGRDDAMERCKSFIRNYGAAGFGYTISTLSVTGVWYSGWGHIGDAPGTVAPETRGATTRLYDEADWKNASGHHPAQRHTAGRRYADVWPRP